MKLGALKQPPKSCTTTRYIFFLVKSVMHMTYNLHFSLQMNDFFLMVFITEISENEKKNTEVYVYEYEVYIYI